MGCLACSGCLDNATEQTATDMQYVAIGVLLLHVLQTVNTYSKSKYSSVIQEAGGWDWFQALLKELR